jgi:hypothetical protein
MRCNKCGRELDRMREMLAQYDPAIGTLCIECYNNSLIEKHESIKKMINRFTSSPSNDTLNVSDGGNNNEEDDKKEDVL